MQENTNDEHDLFCHRHFLNLAISSFSCYALSNEYFGMSYTKLVSLSLLGDNSDPI